MIMSQSEEVQTKVLNALYWDLAVPPHRLKVDVENGWVTISGTVDRYYERTCAESDARRVPGVLGVNNHIRLCVGAGAARGRRPLAIYGSPTRSGSTSPNDGQPFAGSRKTLAVSLISTALRRQSAPAERTVKYGLTEDHELAGSGVTRACSSATTRKSEFAQSAEFPWQTLGEGDDSSPETGGDFLGARRD
jgi:hypothetical protein